MYALEVKDKHLAIIERDINKSVFADKDEIQRLVAEVNTRMGFVPYPDATVEKVRVMMQAKGIRPEDNAFTTVLRAAEAEGLAMLDLEQVSAMDVPARQNTLQHI